MNQLFTCLGILCALFFTTPGFSQKAKDKRVDIKYVTLPAEKLPTDFTTYSVSVTGDNIAIGGLSTTSLENSIKMDGFKRVGTAVDGEFGHLRISVNTGEVSTGRMSWKTRQESHKDDKGVVTKTNYYWYEMPCSGITSYKIVDPEGNILSSGNHNYNSTTKSKEYTSNASLTAQEGNLRSSLRKGYAADMASGAVGEAKSVLSTKYDFAFATDDVQYYWIKKHAEEIAFEAKLDKTIEVFKALPANAPASEGLTKLEECIKLWTRFSEKNPGSDKDLQEVYLACNANLAYTYFYLDNLDESEKHLKRIIAVGEKEKKAERLLERIGKIRTQMNFHNIHTMHYSRDLANALPPSKVKALEEEKEQLAADNNSLPGYMVMKADTVSGTFMRTKADEDFIFGPNGNTKFMVDKAGKMEEQDITKSDVSEFVIGDRKFTRMTFSPCAKGKSEAASHIMEQLYDSEKIKLYKYYPVSGTLSSASNEFAYQKKADAAPVSLMDTQFLLFNKGMANYFSDCGDLKDLCTEGGFKMNEDDLIKAARVYAEVCE
jgi:tetratricopeptide (TPR) repeat protein